MQVAAYETHARIAIEVADWPEYHQCQTVLGHLYEELDPLGPRSGSKSRVGNAEEFMSYRVLQAAAKGSQVLAMEVATIPQRYLDHPFVRHALASARALIGSNYHR